MEACYAILTCFNLHLLVLGGTTCLQAPKLKMCHGRSHSWFICSWPYSVSRFRQRFGSFLAPMISSLVGPNRLDDSPQ